MKNFHRYYGIDNVLALSEDLPVAAVEQASPALLGRNNQNADQGGDQLPGLLLVKADILDEHIRVRGELIFLLGVKLLDQGVDELIGKLRNFVGLLAEDTPRRLLAIIVKLLPDAHVELRDF